MNTITNTNNNPVAFFDSGVGGLTIYSKFVEKCPNENYLYFGDTKHLPYGNKTKDELISYAKFIMDFFAKRNAKAVVIACNTSSSAAYDVIKDDYDFEIYPIIQSCAKIIAELPVKKLGIFATSATINSGVYVSEINKYNPDIRIYPQICPEWVNIVESHSQKTDESIRIIKQDLDKMLMNEPERIILGCTHYPYLLNILSEFKDKNMFIDPAEYFVDYIIKDLKKKNLFNNSLNNINEEFFVSSEPERFVKSAETFYKINVKPVLINN